MASSATAASSAAWLLLPCGSGAYNFSTKPYIMTAGAKPVVAEFDFRPGMEPEGPPELVNASFDAKTGRLESFAKGRGLGDCGARGARDGLVLVKLARQEGGTIHRKSFSLRQDLPKYLNQPCVASAIVSGFHTGASRQ